MRVATLLAMLALIYHAWVGIRDVLMDYIKPTWMRLSLRDPHLRAAGRLCLLDRHHPLER